MQAVYREEARINLVATVQQYVEVGMTFNNLDFEGRASFSCYDGLTVNGEGVLGRVLDGGCDFVEGKGGRRTEALRQQREFAWFFQRLEDPRRNNSVNIVGLVRGRQDSSQRIGFEGVCYALKPDAGRPNSQFSSWPEYSNSIRKFAEALSAGYPYELSKDSVAWTSTYGAMEGNRPVFWRRASGESLYTYADTAEFDDKMILQRLQAMAFRWGGCHTILCLTAPIKCALPLSHDEVKDALAHFFEARDAAGLHNHKPNSPSSYYAAVRLEQTDLINELLEKIDDLIQVTNSLLSEVRTLRVLHQNQISDLADEAGILWTKPRILWIVAGIVVLTLAAIIIVWRLFLR